MDWYTDNLSRYIVSSAFSSLTANLLYNIKEFGVSVKWASFRVGNEHTTFPALCYKKSRLHLWKLKYKIHNAIPYPLNYLWQLTEMSQHSEGFLLTKLPHTTKRVLLYNLKLLCAVFSAMWFKTGFSQTDYMSVYTITISAIMCVII